MCIPCGLCRSSEQIMLKWKYIICPADNDNDDDDFYPICRISLLRAIFSLPYAPQCLVSCFSNFIETIWTIKSHNLILQQCKDKCYWGREIYFILCRTIGRLRHILILYTLLLFYLEKYSRKKNEKQTLRNAILYIYIYTINFNVDENEGMERNGMAQEIASNLSFMNVRLCPLLNVISILL
jgi:hypothetical protein